MRCRVHSPQEINTLDESTKPRKYVTGDCQTSYSASKPRNRTSIKTITYKCGHSVVLRNQQDQADHACTKCYQPIMEIVTRELFTDC